MKKSTDSIFCRRLAWTRTSGSTEKLHNRIQEIHETIGEDAKILDQTEELNEEAMYAIYDAKTRTAESV